MAKIFKTKKYEYLDDDKLFKKILQERIPDEVIRQYKIVKLLIDYPDKYSETNLADIFNTSITTIRRDAFKLRSVGINIYTRKNYFKIDNLEKTLSIDETDKYRIFVNIDYKNERKKFESMYEE